jgi:regulator of replication initiation timing
MSTNEKDSDEIYKTILELMTKSVEEEDVIIMTFEQLRKRLKEKLKRDVGTKEVTQTIGALKNDGKIESRKVAGRDIFYLTEIVKVYKEFRSKKR